MVIGRSVGAQSERRLRLVELSGGHRDYRGADRHPSACASQDSRGGPGVGLSVEYRQLAMGIISMPTTTGPPALHSASAAQFWRWHSYICGGPSPYKDQGKGEGVTIDGDIFGGHARSIVHCIDTPVEDLSCFSVLRMRESIFTTIGRRFPGCRPGRRQDRAIHSTIISWPITPASMSPTTGKAAGTTGWDSCRSPAICALV